MGEESAPAGSGATQVAPKPQPPSRGELLLGPAAVEPPEAAS